MRLNAEKRGSESVAVGDVIPQSFESTDLHGYVLISQSISTTVEG